MGSESGKYIIPFGMVILVLNVVLILILAFQDIIIPKTTPVVSDDSEFIVSEPVSLPVSFTE